MRDLHLEECCREDEYVVRKRGRHHRRQHQRKEFVALEESVGPLKLPLRQLLLNERLTTLVADSIEHEAAKGRSDRSEQHTQPRQVRVRHRVADDNCIDDPRQRQAHAVDECHAEPGKQTPSLHKAGNSQQIFFERSNDGFQVGIDCSSESSADGVLRLSSQQFEGVRQHV